MDNVFVVCYVSWLMVEIWLFEVWVVLECQLWVIVFEVQWDFGFEVDNLVIIDYWVVID